MARWQAEASELDPKPGDGLLRPYAVGAIVLLVVGVLCLLVELQSSSLIYWTGERIVGTNDGGIIYYTVDGDQRTLNDPDEPPARPEPVTVYADPDDSSQDRIAGPEKWFDAAFVVTPFAAAGVVMLVGLARRRRILRQAG